MIDLKALKQFLLKANIPHAFGTGQMEREEDGSRTITFRSGQWSMNDNFFGGEPYGGRQVVYYKGRSVWLCTYYGRVHSTSLSPDAVYDFLREALRYPTQDKPFRGPEHYAKGNLVYRNKFHGSADNFSSKEFILESGKSIYEAVYSGGLVDQRAQDSF